MQNVVSFLHEKELDLYGAVRLIVLNSVASNLKQDLVIDRPVCVQWGVRHVALRHADVQIFALYLLLEDQQKLLDMVFDTD